MSRNQPVRVTAWDADRGEIALTQRNTVERCDQRIIVSRRQAERLIAQLTEAIKTQEP